MSGLTEFPAVLECGCGLDVHQKTVGATVQCTDIVLETITFGTFTPEIMELGIWLNSLGVTHIAMESAGIDNNEEKLSFNNQRILYGDGEGSGTLTWEVSKHLQFGSLNLKKK